MARTKTETMESFAETEQPETEQPEAKQHETKQFGKKKEKYVRFKIPRGNSEKEQRDVFVSVNGKTWQIKRGVVNELPESVVEVLENAEAQRDFALEYQESVKEQVISEKV